MSEDRVMSKTCYIDGCNRYGGWLIWDEDFQSEVEVCAEHAGYDDWEAMQAEVDVLLAKHHPTGPCGVPHPYAGRPCSRPAGHPASEGHGNDQVAWLATEPTDSESGR